MPKSKPGREHLTVDVVVEIPQGSRNKFEWDAKRHVMRLDRRIPGAVFYPTHYGFVPDTLAPDGDPVDALVIAEEPLYPGVWLTGRPIGVGWLWDSGVLEPKIVCVPENDPGMASIRKLSDLPPLALREIEQFFDVYKILEPGRETRFVRWGGRKQATAAIRHAQQVSRPADGNDHANIRSDSDVAQLVARLREIEATIGVAESCTGGLVASSIAATDGAGQCFRGAVVAYAEDVKYRLLGVTPGSGVINAPAARQMADGARHLLGSDVGLATTGVVGPDPEEDQPVGTIWIGVASGNGRRSAFLFDIDGDPDCVRSRALHEAIGVAAAHLS
jgi:inorganic pyrophosphatase